MQTTEAQSGAEPASHSPLGQAHRDAIRLRDFLHVQIAALSQEGSGIERYARAIQCMHTSDALALLLLLRFSPEAANALPTLEDPIADARLL